ncbi:MAG: hypothetical protein Q8N23_05900 [Archangium sp.]|nr:hypothetical protein [Archangium sp.]MDP3574935.1 hypothetical protein [Archangium sp.]
MHFVLVLLVLQAPPSGPVEYAPGVQVRKEGPPSKYVRYPTVEELANFDSPFVRSWTERLGVGDAEAWTAAFKAAEATLASGGAEALRTKWRAPAWAKVLCAQLPSAPEKVRPLLEKQWCRVLDDGLQELPLDELATSMAWLEARVGREALLARLGAPAIAAALVKAVQARKLPWSLRMAGQPARSETWWKATRLAVEQVTEVEQQLELAALVPRRLPESTKWLEAFCAKTARTDAERKTCSAAAANVPSFRGRETFLDSYDVLGDAKRLSEEGTTPAQLATASEACVRNEDRAFSSEARVGCLSLLTELDFARACELISDEKIWFVTSEQHFELVAAVVMGKPPVEALLSVGLVPAGFVPAPFSAHYPRDLLRAAGTAGMLGVERGEVSRAVLLGRTPLMRAFFEYEPKGRAATLWFKGKRYSATLKAGGAGAGVAAFLNEVARREKLEARWLCLGEGYFSDLVVGTETQLRQGLEKKLLLRADSVPME